MMIPMRENVSTCSRYEGIFSSTALLYFVAEFLIGAIISASIGILKIVKSCLPKPPRDLTDEVVLITGATSSLGRCLAEEFARCGCSIVCVDSDLELVRKTACELDERYKIIKGVGPNHRKQDATKICGRARAYQCNLWRRDAIRDIAKRVKDEIGRIDVLITCAGNPGQNIFDTVSTTLMSHYWTVLAFLPSMLRQQKAHIIGVTPTASTEDAYMGTRAAIAGLMESLGHEFSGGQVNFLTVAPKADPRLLRQSEQKVAFDVVQAVRRNQCCLSGSWLSKTLYYASCIIHTAITRVTRCLYTQGCDDLY